MELSSLPTQVYGSIPLKALLKSYKNSVRFIELAHANEPSVLSSGVEYRVGN
jgi:hypothetical protein